MSILQIDPFRELERWLGRQSPWGSPSSMPMDAYRHDGTLEVDFDIPGVDVDKIELTVEQNVLTVKAERAATLDPDGEMIAAERRRGSFRRELLLGESLDAEHVEAAYRDGVLHVSVPIAEASKARRIEIRSGARKAIGVGSGAA